ncbi:unannotated protein [freshwater metagenome]|uniref:Unannotated protein n=1 Tax=freshwater metagenome TaxID=449393 RepID=A0A6J6RC61_9ZZZZ
MTGKGGRLVADALHQTAVADNHVDVVVHDIGTEARAKLSLRDSHADSVREALTERPGGDLHASGVTDLGVTRRCRTPLTERLDVVELKPVPVEEQQRVLQDRGVTAGEDEAISVRPVGPVRIVLHDSAVEHVREGSERHGRPLVSTLGVQGRIDGEAPDQRDGGSVLSGCEAGRHSARLVVRHRGARPLAGPRGCRFVTPGTGRATR